MMFLLQRRNALAQFVYGIVEMTDCILEALLEPINSIIQAFIDAFMGAFIGAVRGRLCRSIWHEWFCPLLAPIPMLGTNCHRKCVTASHFAGCPKNDGHSRETFDGCHSHRGPSVAICLRWSITASL